MKFAIIMSTYRRNDGKTIELIERAINSIFNQTYQEFKLFLIGDKFENDEELIKIISKYDTNKILYKNLKFAKEREIYNDKWSVWSYGGVNAVNIGLEYAIEDGFDYICHLDHDDWWYENHLEEINECIKNTKADWMCTLSTYLNINIHYPQIKVTEKYTSFLPLPQRLIHSSVCFNIKTIPLRYKDIFMIEGINKLPSDADLWARQNEYIRKYNLKSFLIKSLTCIHDQEGYER